MKPFNHLMVKSIRVNGHFTLYPPKVGRISSSPLANGAIRKHILFNYANH